jgi:hypothetical protein
MKWERSHHADPRACALADRHYSRKTVGAPQFCPPGRKVVFLTDRADAVWATSWPFAEYVAHAWAGAWVNTMFRNESSHLSSELIREAVAATRYIWPDVPDQGIVTFIDMKKVRKKRDFGVCYRHAGWHECGMTKGGHLVLRQLRDEMPEAEAPLGMQLALVA